MNIWTHFLKMWNGCCVCFQPCSHFFFCRPPLHQLDQWVQFFFCMLANWSPPLVLKRLRHHGIITAISCQGWFINSRNIAFVLMRTPLSSSLGHWFIVEADIWKLQAGKSSATGASSQHQIPTTVKKDIQRMRRTLQRESPMAPNPIKLAKILLIFFLLSHPILHATYLCHFGNFNFVKYSVPLPPPLSSSFFLPPSPSSLLLLLLLFLLPLRWKIPYVLFCYVAMYWRGAIKIHKKLLTHKTQKNHCASWDRFLPLTIFRPSHLFPEKILYRVLQLKNSARHSRQWLDKTTNVLSNHWRAIFFD